MNTCKKDVLGFPCQREAGHSGLCDPRYKDYLETFVEFAPTTTRDVLFSPMLLIPVVFACVLVLSQLGLDIYLLVR